MKASFARAETEKAKRAEVRALIHLCACEGPTRDYRPSLSFTLLLASTAAASTAECAPSSLSLSVL